MTTLQELQVQGYTLTSEELLSRLSKLGIDDLRIDTLKTWSKNKLIPPFKVYYQKKVRRRGHPGNPVTAEKEGRVLQKAKLGPQLAWQAKTIEQAAAVWAVRESYRSKDNKKKRLSKYQINVIKRVAAILDERPFAIYTVPPVTGPLSTQRIDPESIEMTFVSEDCDGLDLFPGTDNAERVESLNELVVTWIAAREKVRAWASEGLSATYILEQHPEFGDLTPGEVNFSRLDPWRREVDCPWRIDSAASVTLHWWSRPSKNKSPQFGRMAFPVQRTLTKSDRNKIVLYENGVDTRAFFIIDVGDRQKWAKAEQKKLDSEYKDKVRSLRRLGIEKIYFKTLLALEKAPLGKLTTREKAILKTANEIKGIAWRRAQLKSFSV